MHSLEQSITITAGAASTVTVPDTTALKVGETSTIAATVYDMYGNLVADDTTPLKVGFTDDIGTATDCTLSTDVWMCDVTYTADNPLSVVTLYTYQDGSAIAMYTIRVVGGTPSDAESSVTPDAAVMGATVLASVELKASSGMLVMYEPDHPTVTLSWEGETGSEEAVYSATSKKWLASVTVPAATVTGNERNLIVSFNGTPLMTHTVTMEDQTPSATESVVTPDICAVSESQGFSIGLANSDGVTIVDSALVVTLKWSDEDTVYSTSLSTDSGAYASLVPSSEVEGSRSLEVYIDGTLFLSHSVTQYTPPEAAVGTAIEVSGKDADGGYGDTVVMGEGWTIISAPLNGDDDEGKVFVMKQTETTWSQYQVLEADTSAVDGHYGDAMCLTFEGTTPTLYIGQPGREAVDVVQYSSSTYQWEHSQSIQAPNPMLGDGFGSTLACEGDLVLVGAPYSYTQLVPNTGSAYLFDMGGQSLFQTRIVSSSPEENAMFGSGLGLAGDMAAVTTGPDASIADETVVLQYDSDLDRWETASNIPYGGSDIVLSTEILGVADPALDGGFAIYTAATGWGALSSGPTDTASKMIANTKDTTTDEVSLALGGGTLVVVKSNTAEGTGTLTVFTKSEGTGAFVGSAPIEVSGTPESVAVDESGNLFVGKSGDAGTEVTAFDLASPTALVLIDAPDSFEQGTTGVSVQYYFLDSLSAAIAITDADNVTMGVGDAAAVEGVASAEEYYTSIIDIPEEVGRVELSVDTGNGTLPGAILVVAGAPDATESEMSAATDIVVNTNVDFSVVLKSSYGDVVFADHDVEVKWTYMTPAGTNTEVTEVASMESASGTYSATVLAGKVVGSYTAQTVLDTDVFLSESFTLVAGAPTASESSIYITNSTSLEVGDTVNVSATLLDEWTNVCDNAADVSISFGGVDCTTTWNGGPEVWFAQCPAPTAGEQPVVVSAGGSVVLSTTVTIAAAPVDPVDPEEPSGGFPWVVVIIIVVVVGGGVGGALWYFNNKKKDEGIDESADGLEVSASPVDQVPDAEADVNAEEGDATDNSSGSEGEVVAVSGHALVPEAAGVVVVPVIAVVEPVPVAEDQV
ncbi:hypothetical protein KIPB_001759 [Kipferlia bialata]|uniref:Uncharacterized protein n=1 Tax=Kipferlia bialata TaxID=797122 RepID=A0A391NS76_9EUKA|nr:hypothetical protein KIPB_001759 [Kipferlia bialata]|eukprot:g1759.t1